MSVANNYKSDLLGWNAEREAIDRKRSEIQNSGDSSPSAMSALRQLDAREAAIEAENQAAYIALDNATAVAGHEDRLHNAMYLSILEQNPTDGQKRVDEARARVERRSRLDAARDNAQAADAMRREQREYPSLVARNSTTGVSKHLALSAVTAKAEVDRAARAASNGALTDRQESLEQRQKDTRHGPSYKFGDSHVQLPLTATEKR